MIVFFCFCWSGGEGRGGRGRGMRWMEYLCGGICAVRNVTWLAGGDYD